MGSLALAVTVHVALAAGLLASVRRLAPPPEPPPLDVALVPPEREEQAAPRVLSSPPDRSRFPTVRRPLAQVRPAPSLIPPLLAATPPAPAPPVAAARPAVPNAAAPARDDLAGRVRESLRTSVGCDDDPAIDLSPSERASCARRRARAAREAVRPPPNERQRAFMPRPERRDAHRELRPEWDCAAGGSLGCRGSGVMAGGSIPFGYVPKALPPIPLSTLHGDDRIKKDPPPE